MPSGFAYIEQGKKLDDFYDFKIIYFLTEKRSYKVEDYVIIFIE